MKNVLTGLVCTAIILASCSSGKEISSLYPIPGPEYENIPFVKKYAGNPFYIPPEKAFQYLELFRKHKYRIIKKKELAVAWSKFNLKLLKDILNDPEVDSVFFLNAAHPKNGVPPEFSRHPFIIMQVINKPTSVIQSGSGEYTTQKTPVYFSPVKICPPPNVGCRVQGYE